MKTRTSDKSPFVKTRVDGTEVWLVSGSIPGYGVAHGRASDQVRLRVQGEAQAEANRAELQAQRQKALDLLRARRVRALRMMPTSLSPSELQSAEAAATLIRDSKDSRTIFQLVKEGLAAPDVEDQPLSALLPKFEEAKKSETLAARSFDSLLSRVKKFVREVGDFPNEQQVREWINLVPSRDGRKNRRADAGNFLGWCHRKEFTSKNVIAAIPVPKHDPDEAIEDLAPGVLTPEQARKLLKCARDLCDGKLVLYVAMGLFAGLRPSEIGRLKETRVRKTEILVHGKNRRTSGERLMRQVPIEENLAAILKTVDFDQQVLVVDDGRTSRSKWDAVRSAAGILDDWDPDCLRHSYCSYRIARGLPRDAQHLLVRDTGNSVQVLLRYYNHPRSTEEACAYWSIT